MIPVNQTIFGFENGNCMQACVASVFELELNDVPNFMSEGPDRFHELLLRWCNSKGLTVFDINTGGDCNKIFKDAYVIVAGPSPRNKDKSHAVIYYNDKMVHDPHPDKSGIIGDPEYITVFALKDYRRIF